MKRIFIVILFLSCLVNYAKAGWERVYKHSATNFYQQWGLVCADSLNCFSCGTPMPNSGTMFIKSSDGGLNWNVSFIDTAKIIYDEDGYQIGKEPPRFGAIRTVCAPTRNRILGGHEGGQISLSTDGGQTFELKQTPLLYDINSIKFFTDTLIGIAIGPIGMIITTDGGETWANISKNIDSSEYNCLMDCISLNGNDIYAAGRYMEGTKETFIFYKSTDKGNSWKKRTMIYPNARFQIMDFNFVSNSEGWLAGRTIIDESVVKCTTVILHTTDAGENWEVQLDSADEKTPYGLNQIYFADKQNGIAMGGGKSIWSTTDGGKIWIKTISFDQTTFDEFSKLAFPTKSYNKFLAAMWESGEIWLYDENLSAADPATINMDIFPNPASDFITIDSAPGERVEIYSQLGMKILEAPPGAGKIDVSALPAGVYFLKVGGKAGKFIKI